MLAGLGASPEYGLGSASARLVVRDLRSGREGRAVVTGQVGALPGLPGAVPLRAAAALLALAGLVSLLDGRERAVDPDDVAIMLLLPLVMAVAYEAPFPDRRAPMRRPDGFLAAELGAPGDEAGFERMLGTLPPGADVLAVCEEAQLWHLPVLPYRSTRQEFADRPWCAEPMVAGASGRWGAARPDATPVGGPEPLSGVVVLDLTVMWAGPLASWLLAGLGAEVITIEPAIRPDGSRAPRGGGIYPAGELISGDGSRSAMFNALARGKDRRDLDLRQPSDRSEWLAAVADADVVIDSLSPRARRQLGLTADQVRIDNPELISVTIPAFGPDDPHRNWGAYGSQIHAISGLAYPGDDSRPIPAASAYPDALAGMLAALATVAALLGRKAGWFPDADLEVPLAASVSGLAPIAGDDSRLRADAGALARALFRERPDRFQGYIVAGRPLAHPRIPLGNVKRGESRTRSGAE